MTAETVLHHAALVVAVAALLAAGLRVSSLAAPRGLQRATAAVVLAAAAAIAEALGLGLVSLGGSSVALLLAALATWAAARLLAPAPAVGLRRELAEAWQALAGWPAIALAAVIGAWAAWAAWLLIHPGLGHDMVLYHLPEAISWVHNGRPGSIVPVISVVPVGTYPTTHEVLLEWGMAIGRSFVWASVVTAAMPALVAAAAWLGLNALRIDRVAAGLAAAALVATPAVIATQEGGATLDPAALAWLTSCAALCAVARDRPGLLAPALVAGALAIGTKTSAAPLAVAAIVTAAWVSRRALRAIAPALIASAALAVVVGGVWYIRNLFDHGWPLWPFSSAPWGDPRPRVIADADVRFIQRPGETLSRLGSYYWHHFAGPIVLLGGAAVVAMLARSRGVIAAALAAAASVLLWANAPFTGVLPARAFDIGTGDATRYLLPGVAAATLAVALAARRGGYLRGIALAILVGALALGLHDSFALGFPSVPSATTPIAGALVLAAAGAALRRAGLRPPPLPATAVVCLAGLGVAGALAAHGYVHRHGRTGIREAGLATWFAGRPEWRDGTAPVGSTWSLIATLAGDRLQHRLILLGARSACRHSAGAWVVLDLHEQQFERARPCAGRAGYRDKDFIAYGPDQAGGHGTR